MKNTHLLATLSVGTALFLSSCADMFGPQNTYKEDAIGMTQDVYTGTITSITPVKITGDNANTGTALGAVAGGLGASTLGGGRGNTLFTAGGVLAGAAIGNQIQKGMDSKAGIRVVVKLDGQNKTMSVTQVADKKQSLYVGQRVNIYSGYKGSFVEPMGY